MTDIGLRTDKEKKMNNPVFLYGQIAQEKAMRSDETVACRNATVFQEKDGNFSG